MANSWHRGYNFSPPLPIANVTNPLLPTEPKRSQKSFSTLFHAATINQLDLESEMKSITPIPSSSMEWNFKLCQDRIQNHGQATKVDPQMARDSVLWDNYIILKFNQSFPPHFLRPLALPWIQANNILLLVSWWMNDSVKMQRESKESKQTFENQKEEMVLWVKKKERKKSLSFGVSKAWVLGELRAERIHNEEEKRMK